jgi:hypothetical protein
MKKKRNYRTYKVVSHNEKRKLRKKGNFAQRKSPDMIHNKKKDKFETWESLLLSSLLWSMNKYVQNINSFLI